MPGDCSALLFEKDSEIFAFKEQFANSPLVHKLVDCAEDEYFGVIIAFINRGKKEKVLKDVDIEIMGSYLFHPIAALLKKKAAEKKQLTKKEKKIMFEMAWEALSL